MYIERHYYSNYYVTTYDKLINCTKIPRVENDLNATLIYYSSRCKLECNIIMKLGMYIHDNTGCVLYGVMTYIFHQVHVPVTPSKTSTLSFGQYHRNTTKQNALGPHIHTQYVTSGNI